MLLHCSQTDIWIWIIAAAATAGVLIRPFQWPEAVWAVGGAMLLVLFRLLSPAAAYMGVAKGTDVYLFLVGMMLLAETAREEGLFEWLAALAAQHAKGSASRLFVLVYGVGTIVTIFLSNDATAVVLTPAVAAVVKAAKVEKPLPFLFICAFIANAASFVLPISNPANLVIYGKLMPPLLHWLPAYALPSLLSILATFAVLRWTQRKALNQNMAVEIDVPQLSRAGKTAAWGICFTAIVLLVVSTLDIQLGLPTFIAGTLTAALVLLIEKKAPWVVLKGISWGVLPLVAGLFVLVEALGQSGVIQALSGLLKTSIVHFPAWTAWGAGTIIAFGSNLINNLPAGLIAGQTLQHVQTSHAVTSAVLIGVDLGPNLSITGSLATILWLTALRREGQTVSAWTFLKLGLLIMPPALFLAIGSAVLLH